MILVDVSDQTRRSIWRGVVTVFMLAVVALGVLAYTNRQFINDYWAAERFEPTAQIATVTDNLFLTDAGHRVFWASEPSLDDAQQFNENCAAVDHDENGHILGCFANSKIYLFNIQDDRLNGIVEVTAAHELLHAVFQRVQGKERTDLVNNLIAYYDEIKSQHPELEERMQVYGHLSRVAFANELHSVFGTEAWPLPSWLEAHYAVWFEDQPLIAEYYDSYRAIFDELFARSEEISAELDRIRADVEARNVAYEAAVEQFNSDWAVFNKRNEAYEFSNNTAEFYRIREDFYARYDALNAEMNAINSEIARYEELRSQLEELSELNNELQGELSSDLTPATPTTPQA